MIYSELSRFYDSFNSSVDYSAWADFYEELFTSYAGREVSSVLDLACGTGSMTLELAKRGYDMTGVDISSEMLSAAVQKATEAKLGSILWLNQDMREFELYGTVDAIICVLDGINYLSDVSELKKVFSLAENYLFPGGLFIFDVNTPYKFENCFGNNSYIFSDEGIYCGWQNYFSKRSGNCSFYLTMFELNPDGTYTRRDEYQREHCFSMKTIIRTAAECGLEKCGVFSGFGREEPDEKSERWHFVFRKGKWVGKNE